MTINKLAYQVQDLVLLEAKTNVEYKVLLTWM